MSTLQEDADDWEEAYSRLGEGKSDNIFLGDTTYPHTPITPAMVPSASAGEVVIMSKYEHKRMTDRIEQLERELEEAQKDAARYSYALDNSLYFGDLCINLNDVDSVNEVIDAAIQEGK